MKGNFVGHRVTLLRDDDEAGTLWFNGKRGSFDRARLMWCLWAALSAGMLQLCNTAQKIWARTPSPRKKI